MWSIGSHRRFSILFVALALLAGTVIAHETVKTGTASDDLHKAMMENMKPMHDMKMSGDVDKDFAAMMIGHHQQAIAMAKVELAKGKNAELKSMAQKMIDQQQKEIEDLKRFK